MALRSTNQERYATVQTYGGTALAAGPLLNATFETYEQAGKVIPMGDASGFGRRDRGGIFQIASDAVDNTALTIVVWAVVRLDADDHSAVDSYELRKLGTLTATISSAVGSTDSDLVDENTRKADAMSWSSDAYGTFVKTMMGGQFTTYSNTGNVAGALGLSDVGNCMGLIFETTSNPGTNKTVYVLSEVGT